MSSQQAHSYVNGTSALKIRHDRHERRQAGPKVIRVDFGAREEKPLSARSFDGMTSVRRVSTLSCDESLPKPPARAQRDLSVVIDALGLKEMKEEFEYGSAAGVSMGKGSFALTAACCACLFFFCMLVLVF